MVLTADLKIEEINNKETWEGFVLKCDEKSFLHSWNWGEFQKMLGERIWRFGVFDRGQLISVALMVKVSAKRGTFLFVPHGPVVRKQETVNRKQILKILISKLKEIAKEEKADFIRVASVWQRTEENNKIFKDLGFKEASIHMHPELTWELDITLPEDELLMGMRKTTRYLIRQAQKNQEIEIIKSQNLEDVEKFNQLYQETVKQHHFVPFSLDYLKNEFLAFAPDNQIAFFLGKYRGEVICSAMVIYYSGIGFYHQGASSRRHAKIPASYLMQWEAVREARRRGCKIYNFWGIAPIDDKKPRRNPFRIPRGRHPWYGLSLFKMGFGGQRKEYVKTQDLPLSFKYWLTHIFEKIRKIKRRL